MTSVNRHLLWIVLSALLPLLAAALVLGWLLVSEHRKGTEHALAESARLLSHALDAEMNRSIAALNALSLSDSLRRGDLQAFYAKAQEVQAALGQWDNLQLLSPSAEHLLNLRRPYGERLPPVPQPEAALAAARTGKPSISDGLRGRVQTDWQMYIAFPAIQDGTVRYVIGATMNSRYWSRWLAERAPSGVIITVADRKDVILARSREAERFAGQLVPQWFRIAAAGRQEGTLRGLNMTDSEVVVSFQRSAMSGWSVNLLASGEALDAPMRRTALLVGVALLAALGVAALLAYSRAAVITRGLMGLRGAMESLIQRRAAGPALTSPVREIQEAMVAAGKTADVLNTREAWLERAEQAARLGLWDWDLKADTVTWSRGIFGLVGTEPGAFAPSESRWLSYIATEDRERVQAAFRAIAARGGDFREEFRIRREDGELRWLACIGRVDHDEHGQPVRLQGVNLDITSLREADRRKDEFLATLAHELRNPLAPIRNALYLLSRRTPEDPSVRAAEDMMARQVDHMVRLIDDLLDVSRITRGRLELRRETVELSRVIEQALETSRPHLQQQLTVTLPTEPVFLDADPVRLSQVIGNLLNNAAKYTDPTGRITVAAAREGPEVVIRVRDTGIGIARDQIPKLFQMFSQAEGAVGRSQGGLGIGLSLAKSLVELHGGRIAASSEGPGRGSEFTVRLPVLSVPEPSSLPAGPAPADYTGAVRRVLVVDDNEDAMLSLAELLRMDGNEVQTALDGMTAVAQAESFKPDLILLDLGLPGLDGFETCNRIRKRPWGKGIVIVALTGWGQENDRRRSQAAGFDAHLVKPVDYEEVRALLASPLMA